MNEVLNNIVEAERGGLLDLGKALRRLVTGGGGGGGGGAPAADVNDFFAGVSGKYVSPDVLFDAGIAADLPDAATITADFATARNFVATITANRLIANPSNARAGQSGFLLIQQDAVGGHTPTFGAAWKFSTPPSFITAPNAWTLVRYEARSPTELLATVEGGSTAAINAASVAEIRAGLEALKYISPQALIASEAVVTLLDEPVIDIDLGEGVNFQVTLGDNRQMGSPLDQMPGRSGEIIVRQDATGGWGLTWHADWKYAGPPPALNTAPNAATVFRYRVVAIGNVQLIPPPVAATVEDLWAGVSATSFLSPQVASAGLAPVVLADAPTITPDFADGFIFSLTIQDNRLIANPVNQKRQSGFFYVKQGTAGDKNLSWGAAYKFIGNVVPTIPQDPGEWTVIPYWAMATNEIICGSAESVSSGGGGGTGIVAATAAEAKAALNATKYISPFALGGFFAPTVLPDNIVITPNLNNGLTFIATLRGNRQIANIENQKIGFGGYFVLIQDGVGGHIPTWGTHYTFQGGTPVLDTTPGAWTAIPYLIQDFGVVRIISPQVSPIPPPASVAEARAGTLATKYLSPQTATSMNAPVDLTDGPIISVNFAAGRVFRVTLGGNNAFANPTNQVAGQDGLIIIRQDNVGGWVPSWGNEYVTDGNPVIIGMNPGQKTVVPYYVEAPGLVSIG